MRSSTDLLRVAEMSKKSPFSPFPHTSPSRYKGTSNCYYGRTESRHKVGAKKKSNQYPYPYREDFGYGYRDENYREKSELDDSIMTSVSTSKHGHRVYQPWISSILNNSTSPNALPPVLGHGINPPPDIPRRGFKSLFNNESALNVDYTEERDSQEQQSRFPPQARHHVPSTAQTAKVSLPLYHHEIVGHPSLNLHRLRLPSHLMPLLDTIVRDCEKYTASLTRGWKTDLYSLTKQDIALREIPHTYNTARPIVSYIKRAAMIVYGAKNIKLDRNQPHVLKYSAEDGSDHTGVELHHDKCDYTANLMLSRSKEYSGGG